MINTEEKKINLLLSYFKHLQCNAKHLYDNYRNVIYRIVRYTSESIISTGRIVIKTFQSNDYYYR